MKMFFIICKIERYKYVFVNGNKFQFDWLFFIIFVLKLMNKKKCVKYWEDDSFYVRIQIVCCNFILYCLFLFM